MEFIRRGRKITEIKFYTPYRQKDKEYQLEETYGVGYVNYRLLGEGGTEVPLNTLEETAGFRNVTFAGDFIMAVPVIIFGSGKWKGRGKALFDSKTESLDALDEVISQWLDAVRMGRVKRYIPEDMIPRDPNTGALIEANPFDKGGAWAMISKLGKTAGIHAYCHRWRRSFITDACKRGMPIEVAARLAGHKKLNTTARYRVVGDDEAREASVRFAVA